ncbi:MAG: ABC transporter permease [Bacillota bacterium]|nr:ABC transporter permease [Bacillota bacterium]
MRRYIARRLLLVVPVLLGVSLLTFLMIHLTPGDPVQLMLGDQATPEAIALLKAKLGLDQPLHVQFGHYLINILHGDLGDSIRTNRPVMEEIGSRFPATVELTALSTAIAITLGVGIGTIAAIRQNSPADSGSMVLAIVWVSMPSFWLGIILQLLFAVEVPWFPIFGRSTPVFTLEWIKSLVLPAVTLGARSAAILARMTRSTLLEVIREDYIRTARSKGLTERVVIYRHALRNALIPVTTLAGLQFGALLGGAFIVETVFAWPGVGRLGVQAIFMRDIPVVQGMVLLVALMFVLVNMAVDLFYAYLDPRIRYG